MTTQKHWCAIEMLTGAIEGKYKAVILYHLMHGTKRFNELGRLIPDASQRMLTQHLRELERDGLVHREVYRETRWPRPSRGLQRSASARRVLPD